jgi:hypothetical protein
VTQHPDLPNPDWRTPGEMESDAQSLRDVERRALRQAQEARARRLEIERRLAAHRARFADREGTTNARTI